jgi:YidC/Oxa1 family membrane protein insertase
MEPLYVAVSWIMVRFHAVLSAIGLDERSGVTWSLSIVGLVVVIRILLIPLFVKQIKAQRGLQVLQPEIKKLQEKYKSDRERQSQELMKLYRETGTNPLASCLPILAQAPIFFALFGVLNGIAGGHARGVLTPELVRQASDAQVFGAKIFDTFLAADNTAARVVALVLIVLMSATTFLTQKQLMSKNMPASAMEGPFAQQQKILLYVFPVIFAVTGVNFPIGVLLYWFTTNLWSMGQQFYVIHRMPAPGSVAAENLERKRAARAARHDHGPAARPAEDGSAPHGPAGPPAPPTEPKADGTPAPGTRPGGQRQQPRRQSRAKRR